MVSEKDSVAFDTLFRPSMLRTSGAAILGGVVFCVVCKVGYSHESQTTDRQPTDVTCVIVDSDTVLNELPYLDCER